MSDNKIIHFIPPLPPKREKRVGIYCRVSINSAEQLKSLAAQVSALTRLVAANPKWLLVDVYLDVASSKTGSSRIEFTRMLKDCESRVIEIVLTKSISRFGRDTVEILDALNQLRALGVRVIFEQEVLDTADTDNDLMISIIESIAQAENESRSENIKWGIKQRAAYTTQVQYDTHSLHSGNLYQIFTYVKNKEAELAGQPHEASGMLLYSRTDETIQPDNEYRMSGNRISVRTLDLNRDFSDIAKQLNTIAEDYFSESFL